METYSTEALQQKAKVAYWNDVICDVFTAMETDPLDLSRFDGKVSCDQLGQLSFSKVVSLPANVSHSRKHVARANLHHFFLHLQARGKLALQQNGVQTLLGEGDFAISDSSYPYQLSYSEPCETIVLGIPASALRSRIPQPEQLSCVFMSGRSGLSNTASVMLKSLWRQVESGIPEAYGPRIADNLLDIIATAYSLSQGSRTSRSATTGARLVQIKRFIESNLHDPELTPRKIAAAFNISPRYLHMLFSNEEESVSHYILRRRLEECARQMTDVFWRGKTITEIAFHTGFNNSTHFARVFKEQFGVTPREYRNLHQVQIKT
ncbi:MAG: helix-turn-helix domain-containing protein [Gammaproteobacteria bacterium]